LQYILRVYVLLQCRPYNRCRVGLHTQNIKHECRLVMVKSDTIVGQVYPRVGLDCVGLGQNFPLLINRVGMAPIAKSVLKYINITSIAYLHCLLRFLSGLVLLVPELVGCMGWIWSV